MRALAVLLLVTGAVHGQEPEQGQPPLRVLLSAQMEAKTIKLGSPVIVNFLLLGCSSSAVRLVDTYVPAEYELVVTDASGKELPRTPFGEALRRGEVPCFKCETVFLKLFDETIDAMDVREIYKLSERGTYSLRVTRHGWIGSEIVTATSDAVQFTITP